MAKKRPIFGEGFLAGTKHSDVLPSPLAVPQEPEEPEEPQEPQDYGRFTVCMVARDRRRIRDAAAWERVPLKDFVREVLMAEVARVEACRAQGKTRAQVKDGE